MRTISSALALALLVSSVATAEVIAPAKRKIAAAFALKDASGKTVKLSDFKGKTVLLNFWATYCAPCRIEIPWFVEFEKKHKDKGFVVLGVAMDDEGWEVVKPYLAAKPVNYRIILGNEATAVSYGGIDSMPTTFLIDKQGRIAAEHLGLVSKGVYEKDIDALLGTTRAK